MVDWSNRDNAIITDFPRLEALEEEIRKAVNFELGTVDFDADIRSVMVFGSYARGTAVKGESDLDVLVEFTDITNKENFHTEKMWLVGAASNRMEQAATPLMRDWFNGYDILFIELGDMETIQEKKTDDRIVGPDGHPGIYVITRDVFLR